MGEKRATKQSFRALYVVRVKTDRGKVMALWGRDKAVLDAVSNDHDNMEWVNAREALLVGLNGYGERIWEMRRFRKSFWVKGSDPLAYTVAH